MAKMFLAVYNGGRDILITDEQGHWYYTGTSVGGYYGEANLFPPADDPDDSIQQAVANLTNAIIFGTTYGAEEWLNAYPEEEREYLVEQYEGCKNILEVAGIENDGRSCDHTYFYEIFPSSSILIF